jgi:hypothetical protein
MPPERQKHHTSLEPYNVPKRPDDRRLYSRHRKQQVLLFLLHHRIPSSGSTIGRPLADKPLANDPPIEPGYRMPTYSEAADYFRIKRLTTVSYWWKTRETLLKGCVTQKHAPKWPQLENELVRLFTATRERNKIVTMHWFRRTSAEVWKCLYPSNNSVFVFSHGWFWKFLRRAGIVRRRVTKAASKPPSEVVRTVNSFIQFVRKHSRRQGEESYYATVLRSSPPTANEAADEPTYVTPKKTSLRRFPPKLIVNLDETPLPFEFFSGYTYDWKGVTTVAGKSDRSGWDKRQAIIILHIMANNDTPFKPVIIFHGQGTVLAKEQPYYDLKVEVHFNPTAYHNEEMFLRWLEDVYQPYVADNADGNEENLVVMDAAAFHKTPAVMKFLHEAYPPMLTALIPPGLTSYLQPFDTAVNGPFKKLLQQAADEYIKRLEKKERLPEFWLVKDRRIMATHIVAIAWAYLSADKKLIRKAFLNCGISIHPDGRKNQLISIKGVNNTAINPNGWFGYLKVGNALDAYATIPDDDDFITALFSATENVSIKLVTQKQLQAECARRGIPKSGTKPELLAKLQAHEAQIDGGQEAGYRPHYKPNEKNEFAIMSGEALLSE